MKRTPREMVNDYIDRMTDQAKDSWTVSGGTRYYEWEKMRDEWNDYRTNMEEFDNAKEQIRYLKSYLKETGRTEDYKEWISKKLKLFSTR